MNPHPSQVSAPILQENWHFQERDACGVGFLVNQQGRASHDLLQKTLQALTCMEHRGGCGGDGQSGDGAGIATAIPWSLLQAEREEIRAWDPTHSAVGMVFLPQDPAECQAVQQVIDEYLTTTDWQRVVWRQVPVNPNCLGPMARQTMPSIWQMLLTHPTLEGDELEQQLYLLRRRIRRRVEARFGFYALYFASLSCRVVVYKGMVQSSVLGQYELPDHDFLESWLSQKKGRKVSLVAPQRQSKAELIELVERNAELELTRTQRLADRDAAALERLAEVLDLPDVPRRLEAYDISHIQGSDAVASQVVFIDGLPAKQHYRRYKIRNPEVRPGHSDDFASHAEVARRRFSKMTPEDQPDLVLIDGGKGQLSAVMAVLADLGLDHLPVIALAKREEEIFLPGDPVPLRLPAQDPARLLLQRLRDEAHRFALAFHRQQRKARQHASTLDEIPGLGKYRQKLLMEEFRSIARIQVASEDQLAQVPGIGPKIARQIYRYFHPETQAESPETAQVE